MPGNPVRVAGFYLSIMEIEKLTKEQAQEEYNRRLRNHDFVTPEKLDGKTVYDVLQMPEYYTNVERIVNEQIETRTNALSTINEMRKKDKKIQARRHVIDRIFEMGLFHDIGEFIVDIAGVFSKQSSYLVEVRQYIYQLGKLAYDITTESFILEVNPEMKQLLDIATKEHEKPRNISIGKN